MVRGFSYEKQRLTPIIKSDLNAQLKHNVVVLKHSDKGTPHTTQHNATPTRQSFKKNTLPQEGTQPTATVSVCTRQILN